MARRPWFHRAKDGAKSAAQSQAERVPSDLFVKCENPDCGKMLYQRDLEKDLKVCRICGYHFHLTAQERVTTLLDEGSFRSFDFGLEAADPLDFPGYQDKLERHRSHSGLREAVLAGTGEIGSLPLAICVTDFQFIRGSMNSVVGETVARTLEEGASASLPVILVSASGGGARMEEGLLSLMQMAKTAAAMERFDRSGRLSICLLTNMTMAGVFASWASLGDITIAEPGATIGFTGERVAATVQKERVPENFRSAEFNLEHGMIDQVVVRSGLRDVLEKLLKLDAVRMPAAAAGVAA